MTSLGGVDAGAAPRGAQANRVIAHLDLDAFYAQVEIKRLGLDPMTPVAVQQWDGLIAINYIARASGVGRHMRVREAKAKCPALQCVHVETLDEHGRARPDAAKATDKVSLRRYRLASGEIFKLLVRIVGEKAVEKASVDEAYVDLTQAVQAFLGMGAGSGAATGAVGSGGGGGGGSTSSTSHAAAAAPQQLGVIRDALTAASRMGVAAGPGSTSAGARMASPSRGSAGASSLSFSGGAPNSQPSWLPETPHWRRILQDAPAAAVAGSEGSSSSSSDEIAGGAVYSPTTGGVPVRSCCGFSPACAQLALLKTGAATITQQACSWHVVGCEGKEIQHAAAAVLDPLHKLRPSPTPAASAVLYPATVDALTAAAAARACAISASADAHDTAATDDISKDGSAAGDAAAAATHVNVMRLVMDADANYAAAVSRVLPLPACQCPCTRCGGSAAVSAPGSSAGADAGAGYEEANARLIAGAIITAYIRHRIACELRFTVSAGVAHNKMLAKWGSGRNKPFQQTFVPWAAVPALMQHLTLAKIRFLGGKLGASLAAETVRYLAAHAAAVPGSCTSSASVDPADGDDASDSDNESLGTVRDEEPADQDERLDMGAAADEEDDAGATAADHEVDGGAASSSSSSSAAALAPAARAADDAMERVTAGQAQLLPLAVLQSCFGEATGTWCFRIVRGLDDSAITPRLRPKSMLAAKSFRPSQCATVGQAIKWLRMLTSELADRLADDEAMWSRQAKSLVLHYRIILPPAGSVAAVAATGAGGRGRGRPAAASADLWRASNAATHSKRTNMPKPRTQQALLNTAYGLLRKVMETHGCAAPPASVDLVASVAAAGAASDDDDGGSAGRAASASATSGSAAPPAWQSLPFIKCSSLSLAAEGFQDAVGASGGILAAFASAASSASAASAGSSPDKRAGTAAGSGSAASDGARLKPYSLAAAFAKAAPAPTHAGAPAADATDHDVVVISDEDDDDAAESVDRTMHASAGAAALAAPAATSSSGGGVGSVVSGVRAPHQSPSLATMFAAQAQRAPPPTAQPTSSAASARAAGSAKPDVLGMLVRQAAACASDTFALHVHAAGAAAAVPATGGGKRARPPSQSQLSFERQPDAKRRGAAAVAGGGDDILVVDEEDGDGDV